MQAAVRICLYLSKSSFDDYLMVFFTFLLITCMSGDLQFISIYISYKDIHFISYVFS